MWFFFAVMRVTGLHDLPQKNYTTRRFFLLHAFTAKKNYTNYCLPSLQPCLFVVRLLLSCINISLMDIQNVPPRWVLAFVLEFLNFWSDAPEFRSVGGGMCILFEICEKSLFQKCMG